MVVDKAQLRELQLHLENEASLYPRMKAIYGMLDRKVTLGRYDGKLAPKAFDGVVTDAAVLYFISPKALHRARPDERKAALQSFNSEVRRALSEKLARSYEEDARSRGFHIHDDRHLCHACAEHEKGEMGKIGKAAAERGEDDYRAAMGMKSRPGAKGYGVGEIVTYTSFGGREEAATVVKRLPRGHYQLRFDDGTTRDAPSDRLAHGAPRSGAATVKTYSSALAIAQRPTGEWTITGLDESNPREKRYIGLRFEFQESALHALKKLEAERER